MPQCPLYSHMAVLKNAIVTINYTFLHLFFLCSSFVFCSCSLIINVGGRNNSEISVLGNSFVTPLLEPFPCHGLHTSLKQSTTLCFKVWFSNICNPIIHNLCSRHTCRHSEPSVYPTEDDLLCLLISIVSINTKLITLYRKSTFLTFSVIISVCFDV